MTIDDVASYVAERKEKNLVKMTLECELGEDDVTMYVTKTKETYVFEDEDAANALVDACRQNAQFLGVEKKYKAGKMNKTGEIVSPETWSVIAKMAH